jgi:N-formylglutamate amidohydrolase
LIANIPHSSTYIPPSIRKSFVLNDDQLEVELLRMTDWFVDALFSEVLEVGGISVIYNCSRLAVDPERFEDDEKEEMASKGMGVRNV